MLTPKHCAGKTILLIEDDNTMLTVIQTELTKAGACVLIAENGQRGLEVALAEHPDLIILDLLMPVLDGMGFLKKLREDDWGKTAKVMILTSVEQLKKVGEVVGLGVYDYLFKQDWSIDEITRKIMQKLAAK